MIDKSGALESRVLICTAVARDGRFSRQVLSDGGMYSHVCDNPEELCREIERGCGAILVAREVLTADSVQRMREVIDKEPPWSHISVLVLAGQGEVTNAEAAVTRLLGPFRNVTLIERPVRLVTFLGILRATLSDRQRQYETRDLLEQLRESNEALHNFATIASHDLKEPLRVVRNYLQLLARDYRGKTLDEKAEKYIDFTVSAAGRMRTLIDALLSYSHLVTEKEEPTKFDCKEIVDAAILNLEIAVTESSATFEIGNLPTLEADRSQLIQLFQNLISNAIKFKSEVAPHIRISCAREDNRWVFKVSDNGVGLSMEHADKIFEMFRRLHTPDKYPGAGIGLAVCHTIVERHGGKIWVESEPGRGATFFFTLPASDPATAETQRVTPSDQSATS